MWRIFFKDKSSKAAKERLRTLLIAERALCSTETNKKGLKIHV